MDLLIHAGQLFTAVEGQAVLRDQGILISDGAIVAVDHWGNFADQTGATVLDVGDCMVLPGLIDAHTHVVNSGEPDDDLHLSALTVAPAATALKAAREARRHLVMGVTTIRDLGARDWADVALRDAIDAGLHPGPRMLVAGHGITGPGGHMDPRRAARPGIPAELLGGLGAIAGSADEARRAAWEQLMGGADVIKINATLSEYVRALGGQCTPELTLAAMQAICEVAHGAMRKVAAHCHGGPGVQAALDAGVDTFEHGRFLDDTLLAQLAERGRFLVPTLSPEARAAELGVQPRDPGTRRWSAMAAEAMYATVERAQRHGVPIVAGSDAGMPHVRHGEIAFEIEHLARAGLSNSAALAAATRVAAQALGLERRVGQIRPGFAADLVVVAGDPLADLRVLQQPAHIRAVIQNGRVVAERGTPAPFPEP